MRWLRERPALTTAASLGIAAATVAAIAAAWGFGAFADAWNPLHPAWIALTIGAGALTLPTYVLAYRDLATLGDGPIPLKLVARLVVAGFGAFAPGGGFVIDKRALHAIQDDHRGATIRVLGLGALEWAVLAPAAWVCAVVLLAQNDKHVMPSLLWPWAIAVPIGFAIGLWVSKDGEHPVLRGVAVLHELARRPVHHAPAWLGAAAYWALDIASFYGALRFVGLSLSLGETVLAFATGYALTRRSLPLGGAGVTEALMTFSLHWVGLPIPAALAAVVVYRLLNLVLPTIPALMVRPKVKPLVDAAEDGRTARAALDARPAVR